MLERDQLVPAGLTTGSEPLLDVTCADLLPAGQAPSEEAGAFDEDRTKDVTARGKQIDHSARLDIPLDVFQNRVLAHGVNDSVVVARSRGVGLGRIDWERIAMTEPSVDHVGQAHVVRRDAESDERTAR